MADHSQQTLDQFAQIGSRLKSAREQRGFTLRDLSSHTRINLVFLEKIEAGDLNGLPGLAFVKGFVRNYISVLEIKDAELEEALRNLAPAGGRDAQAQLTPSNPQVLDTEAPHFSYVKLGLLSVLAVLILWVGFVLFRGSGPQDTAVQPLAPVAAPGVPVGATAPPPVVPLPPAPGIAPVGTPPAAPASQAGVPPPAPGPRPAPRATQGAAPGTAPPPQGSARPPQGGASRAATAARPGAPIDGRQKLELTIRGLERTWVRLSLDRAPPVDVLLQPAETVAWEASQEIRLTIGRSNGVAVYLNGEEVLLPQEPNRLIPNLVLNKLTLLRLEN